MRNSAVLSYAPAKARHIRSLQNWTNGNGCLGRKEAAYLTHTKELMSLTSSHDGACERLEDWIDDQLIHVCDIFRKVGRISSIVVKFSHPRSEISSSVPPVTFLETPTCISSLDA